MPMYKLEKRFVFEAAHHLPSHNGKCRRVHGHSWQGVLLLKRDHLVYSGPKVGMVIDFYDVGEILRPLLENKLDHYDLNVSTGLQNPTSENLAQWIYEQLCDKLPILAAVRIEETCSSACEYWPDSPAENLAE